MRVSPSLIIENEGSAEGGWAEREGHAHGHAPVGQEDAEGDRGRDGALHRARLGGRAAGRRTKKEKVHEQLRSGAVRFGRKYFVFFIELQL